MSGAAGAVGASSGGSGVRDERPAAIILAAGKGTRMRSDLPKVAFEVGGRPMVCAVVDACIAAGCGRIVAVVGYKQEVVRGALAGYVGRGDVKLEFAVQGEQLGTGHAVGCAAGLFEGWSGDVYVLAGDGPLIRASTLATLRRVHRETGASATLATSVLEDPTGYGRIVRDGAGRFAAIVEQKNATESQRAIREVNPSYYMFESGALWWSLSRVTRNELSGEFYLTDAPGLLRAEGRRVELVDAVPPEDVLSINTPEELSRVDAIFRRRGAAGGSNVGDADRSGSSSGVRGHG